MTKTHRIKAHSQWPAAASAPPATAGAATDAAALRERERLRRQWPEQPQAALPGADPRPDSEPDRADAA